MGLELKVEQKQRVYQKQIEQARILQMNAQELAVCIQEAALENPLIELEEMMDVPIEELVKKDVRETDEAEVSEDTDWRYTGGHQSPEDWWTPQGGKSESLVDMIHQQLLTMSIGEKEKEIVEKLAGALVLNEDRAALNEEAAAVCTACRSEANKKGVELHVSADTPLPVWGDSVRLQQIIQNLITNAIHYTPAGGSIHVDCRAEDETACVSVQDTGCGIAPEDQSAVFDRYFHTTADKKHDSTGLGLTIAQELAHLHHGEITLQSEVGKGSMFTLRLPLLTD